MNLNRFHGETKYRGRQRTQPKARFELGTLNKKDQFNLKPRRENKVTYKFPCYLNHAGQKSTCSCDDIFDEIRCEQP
jgi:hypothetical protein